jgi:hypothetical protein
MYVACFIKYAGGEANARLAERHRWAWGGCIEGGGGIDKRGQGAALMEPQRK